MAELKCSVDNCTYNKDQYCCKGDIMVGGKHADKKGETCCESFRDREGNCACSSSLSHPSRNIGIDCEATKCVYNTDYKCYAEHVDIKGCGACDCGETNCATFRAR